MRVRCGALVLPDGVVRDAVLDLDAGGVVLARTDADASSAVDLTLGTVGPGFANTHSHAFHRLLRGRTNAGRGDFWEWRRRMYDVAADLTPERMREVATAVYSEMRAAGYTAVGEFHYLHHAPGGAMYADHDMELALADAARAAGIRLTILDALYLSRGFGEPLLPEQRRFGDASAEGWLDRWHRLRERLAAEHPEVVLGAAIHSVRAVPADAIRVAVDGLPGEAPLHVHLSEQRAENEACLAATGLTPTALLGAAGVLSARTTVVHATHVTEADVAELGAAGVTASLCPSTEADLGDGLGLPVELSGAGVTLAVGSDQNVVIDPFAETRGVELMARLRTERRGLFSTPQLWRIGGADGHRALSALGAADQAAEVGHPLDLVEVDAGSPRTAGSRLEELIYSATAADVLSTVIRGVHRVEATRG